MIHQNNPPYPVIVTSKGGEEAVALYLLDYSQEHDTLFGCVMRRTGEFWWIPQSEIRFFDNWSMGR